RQADAQQQRAGVDITRTVHPGRILTYGRAEPEWRHDELVAEAQVLFAGEGWIDIRQEALDDALRGAAGHLDRGAALQGGAVRHEPGRRVEPFADERQP